MKSLIEHLGNLDVTINYSAVRINARPYKRAIARGDARDRAPNLCPGPSVYPAVMAVRRGGFAPFQEATSPYSSKPPHFPQKNKLLSARGNRADSPSKSGEGQTQWRRKGVYSEIESKEPMPPRIL
jgi:hypothetical protein